MSELTVRPVDPRDAGWEVWNPAYRVYLWRSVSTTGWASRELEVAGGDIGAVLDWATQHAADGETFTVFAVVDRAGDSGLVRLAGRDPTRVEDA